MFHSMLPVFFMFMKETQEGEYVHIPMCYLYKEHIRKATQEMDNTSYLSENVEIGQMRNRNGTFLWTLKTFYIM